MAEDEVVYSRSWKAILKARQRNLEGTSLKTERLANAPLGDTYKRYQDLSDLDLEIEELVEFVKKNSLGRSTNSVAQARRLRANHPQQTNRTEWKTKTCIVRACVEPAAPSYTCCEKCLKHHKLGPYYKSAGEVDYDGIDSTPQERTTTPPSTEPKASIFDGSPIPRRYIWPVANPRGIKKLP